MEFGEFIQQFAEKVGVAVPEIVDDAPGSKVFAGLMQV
jgi:hypothetical protein